MEAKHVKTDEEREDAIKIRKKVFVEEQGVPLEDEFDQHEDAAEHILVMDGDHPVGTGRWRIVDGMAKFERICVLPSHRKFGVGKIIISTLEECAREKGLTAAKLHGQTQAEPFYEKLGYKSASGVFIEDGIPHIIMKKNLG
ncbi:GNAT family N-acetyltransferase [Fictibacillus sp. FJAT-27399]|uniref:GNAT family N-acetyltransferase n=1 Tax=Fictibacillus sp. FJAT-27399 TaxID=1729689 RepID=UPI000784127F|nr:GNAT family N-acetyltransferase [Fictibacillus sp. FJAT-27399]